MMRIATWKCRLVWRIDDSDDSSSGKIDVKVDTDGDVAMNGNHVVVNERRAWRYSECGW